MFPERSISAAKPGGIDGRRVVLLDDRRPLDPVTGMKQLAVVEGRRPAFGLPLDVEDDLALDRLRPRGVAVSALELGPPELGDAARRRARGR